MIIVANTVGFAWSRLRKLVKMFRKSIVLMVGTVKPPPKLLALAVSLLHSQLVRLKFDLLPTYKARSKYFFSGRKKVLLNNNHICTAITC